MKVLRTLSISMAQMLHWSQVIVLVRFSYVLYPFLWFSWIASLFYSSVKDLTHTLFYIILLLYVGYEKIDQIDLRI